MSESATFLRALGNSEDWLLLEDVGQLRRTDERWRALGRCMAPWILPGDELLLQPAAGQLRLGDIVVFHAGPKFLAHRVCRLSNGQFWARGDNSGQLEGPLPIDLVEGRVIGVRRAHREIRIDSFRDRWSGWVRSSVWHVARGMDARLPGLRLFGESAPVRILAGLTVGEITIESVEDTQRLMAEVITAVMARGGLEPAAIESACSSGRCGVLLAGGKWSSGFGRAVLIPLDMDVASLSGLVLTIQVRFGYRGLGIGGRLLEAAEERARKIGWTALFARVAAENVRSLGLFRSRGFFEAAPWERPAGMAPEDHWLVKRFPK